MMPIQPLLVMLLISGVVLYFRKLRSKLRDRVIVIGLFLTATLFIMRPALANSLAELAGVGRGADLFFYVSIPGLAFGLLLLLSRLRDMEQRMTLLMHELSLLQAQSPPNATAPITGASENGART